MFTLQPTMNQNQNRLNTFFFEIQRLRQSGVDYHDSVDVLSGLFVFLNSLPTRVLHTRNNRPDVPDTPPGTNLVCRYSDEVVDRLPNNNFTHYIRGEVQKFIEYARLNAEHDLAIVDEILDEERRN